jgi:dTDP-4-dehydrorhamnose 3,5-epimerase-like enzyme
MKTADKVGPDITVFDVPAFSDFRGKLGVIEKENLPFQVNRFYYIFNVGKNLKRGEHAHRKLRQLMVCFAGNVTVHLHDGDRDHSFRLDTPTRALYVPNMMWRRIEDFSPDAVLGVFASRVYEPEDYIFRFEEFLAEKRAGQVGNEIS